MFIPEEANIAREDSRANIAQNDAQIHLNVGYVENILLIAELILKQTRTGGIVGGT